MLVIALLVAYVAVGVIATYFFVLSESRSDYSHANTCPREPIVGRNILSLLGYVLIGVVASAVCLFLWSITEVFHRGGSR